MMSALCCRYTFMLPTDGEWGAVDESGTWSGLVGMLQMKVNTA